MGMDEMGAKKTPEIFEILIDIFLAFEHLQGLRKEHRAALPELKKIVKK